MRNSLVARQIGRVAAIGNQFVAYLPILLTERRQEDGTGFGVDGSGRRRAGLIEVQGENLAPRVQAVLLVSTSVILA
ncbi:hypothetical protein [Reyranella sp.]|uniref:hypothetical protein n=1 Tax=Reyranella sp. TaxID=1929291 RepID=UPI003783DFDB